MSDSIFCFWFMPLARDVGILKKHTCNGITGFSI